MNYEIHLYAPKTGKLTTTMMEWLFEHGQEANKPEAFWPVKKLKTKALARHMLRLDPTLIPYKGPGTDIELHFPNTNMGIVLYIHDRGIIIFFPYMSYGIYSRIVLGICYTYIRYLFDAVGDWIINTFSSPEQFENVKQQMQDQGFWFVITLGIVPIPFQIAMLAAGATKYSIWLFLLASGIPRSIRYFGLAIIVYYAGNEAERIISKHKTKAMIGITILILGIWGLSTFI